MKKLILASLIALGAWGIALIPTPASAANCDGVRCMACPRARYSPRRRNNCCRCIPV